MYQIGDMIFYGNIGVCRITDISTLNFNESDENQLYYTLTPLFQECIVHTPVDSNKTFMRSIISKEEAERLIDTIPSIHALPYYNSVVRELTEYYEAALKTRSCAELIEVTMSIYTKKQEIESQKRKFGLTDERFMRRAENLLFGELSIALGIPKEDVHKYIFTRIQIINEKQSENQAL